MTFFSIVNNAPVDGDSHIEVPIVELEGDDDSFEDEDVEREGGIDSDAGGEGPVDSRDEEQWSDELSEMTLSVEKFIDNDRNIGPIHNLEETPNPYNYLLSHYQLLLR